MRVECDRAVPEVPLHVNEAVVEDEAGKHRAKRQHAQRNEHRPRAFVRMIARRSLGWMDMMAVAVRFRLLARVLGVGVIVRSEEHTSELQSLMRISYAVFCLKKKKPNDD